MNANELCRTKVREYCLREGLLTPGRPLHLAAAVAGGADSMALLTLLLQLQPEFGYNLSVCHVNHGLRGKLADRDEAFVRAACARLGVPVRVFRAAEMQDAVGAPPPHASEDWARRLRYACFAQLCREGIDALATAHTANDQAETLLFRLARGTGLHGAAGILPKNGRSLRPLLCLTRAETEAVCRENALAWVQDETNDTDVYARNRLRHHAVPALESVNRAAVENLARFCEKAGRAEAYFARQAGQLLMDARLSAEPEPAVPAAVRAALQKGQPVFRLGPLQAADALILETALHSLLSPVRDAEEKYVQLLAALVRQGSGAVQLTGRVRFCARDGLLWREEELPRPASFPPMEFCPEKQAVYVLPGNKNLKVTRFERNFEEKIQVVHKKDLKNQADYARITTLYPKLVLRCRQPGDRFRPAGRGISKPLRKWMNEAGIPEELRGGLPLLASGSQVLWVCGAGFADGLAADAESKWILELETNVET